MARPRFDMVDRFLITVDLYVYSSSVQQESLPQKEISFGKHFTNILFSRRFNKKRGEAYILCHLLP